MNLLLIFYEADLFVKWVPRLSESLIAKAYSDTRKLMQQRFNLPWPMKDREVFVELTGLFLKE